MTDRARQVYALLRTLTAWAPTVRSATGLDRPARGFVGGHARYVTCPDCLTNDRVLAGCETCGGRGEVHDPRPDPYDRGVAKSIFQGRIQVTHRGAADDDVKRAARERDQQLRRLDLQLSTSEDDAPTDAATRALDVSRTLDKHGSYAELRRVLDLLRDRSPGGYHLALMVAYQPLADSPVEPVRASVVAVCEWLAKRMPDEIRVPAGVQVYTHEEITRMAREAPASIRHAASPAALQRRHERDRTIRDLARDQDLTANQIAPMVGLTKGQVQRILRAVDYMGTATAA